MQRKGRNALRFLWYPESDLPRETAEARGEPNKRDFVDKVTSYPYVNDYFGYLAKGARPKTNDWVNGAAKK